MAAVNVMGNFQRDISYNVQINASGEILLNACLNDCYHDIRIEVLVDLDSLKIKDASANFLRNPTENCPTVAIRMERLLGFTIGRGLNRMIWELFGGSEGCGNIRLILLGLLPLAINAKAAAGFTDEDKMFESIKKRLVGSCAGYLKLPN